MEYKEVTDEEIKLKGWIGVDLDGTLAEYHGWRGPHHIGQPIKPMVDRVLKWVEEGREVRIMTARVWNDPDGSVERIIQTWLKEHIYPLLPDLGDEQVEYRFAVTNEKDYEMLELWDDRCIQVIPNTGIAVGDLSS